MTHRSVLLTFAALFIAQAGQVAALYFTRDVWKPFLFPAPSAEQPHDHDNPDRVTLTEEGRKNLGLVVKPVELQTYRKKVQLPGALIDRPGVSDRGVTAPVNGVITRVHAVPGDTVKPGDNLFTLRLLGESVQNAQNELFKTARESQLNQEQVARVRDLVQKGTVPPASLIEPENQQKRLAAQQSGYRQELLSRGLTPEQIDGIARGNFVKEVTITAPAPDGPPVTETASPGSPGDAAPAGWAYEIQELKVNLGDQVQAGQLLGTLANHRLLSIEGRAFKQEAPLLVNAAQNGWPVEVQFSEDDPGEWRPPLDQTFRIHHLANQIDPDSRTFGFYLPLTNQAKVVTRMENPFLVWRFRPGQRVRLFVPVEEVKDVIVLPAAAVVREGPEAYVFRQNGDAFDRKPVQILFEDRQNVVIANDNNSSVPPGVFVAQNGAAALNRALKAKQAEGGGHGHDHHGHSH